MNVGAAVTASNSQVWSARERSGANTELLPKTKLSADGFSSVDSLFSNFTVCIKLN